MTLTSLSVVVSSEASDGPALEAAVSFAQDTVNPYAEAMGAIRHSAHADPGLRFQSFIASFVMETPEMPVGRSSGL